MSECTTDVLNFVGAAVIFIGSAAAIPFAGPAAAAIAAAAVAGGSGVSLISLSQKPDCASN